MKILEKRVGALEASKKDDDGVWHRLAWWEGQSWADALAAYGEDRIAPDDHVFIITFVGAKDGRPVDDPVHDRDRQAMEAWIAARKAASEGA